MKKKLLFLLAAVFLMGFGAVYGQDKTVSGTVIDDATKQPLPGVTVMVEGTTIGTITDTDGKFEITLPEGSNILVFEYTADYITQKKPAKNGMSVLLVSDTKVLDDLTVVGYNTVKDKGYAGSAQKLDGKEIEKKNPSEITKAIAGEFAGVQVATTTGQPGQQSSVRLRGVSSINSTTNPLYVVDGVPYGADISSIDPGDIASTTVLKDATATALYGARGANGVVLITTKKGTAGAEGKIDIDVKFGLNMRLIPLYETITDPVQYTELAWMGLYTSSLTSNKVTEENWKYNNTAARFADKNLFGADGFSPAYNPFRNQFGERSGENLVDPATGKFFPGYSYIYTPEKWADHIFHTGKKYEATVKFSGGSEKTTYFTSFGFLNDEGYYIQSDWKRFNVRSNIDFQPKKWLNGNINIAYAYNIQNMPGQRDNMNSGFQYVNGMPPIYPVFLRDADGNKVWDDKINDWKYDYGDEMGYSRPYGWGINPAGALQLDRLRHTYHNLVAQTRWEVELYKDLKFSATVGYMYIGQTSEELTNPFYGDAQGIGRLEKTFISYMGLVGNQLLRYKKTIKNDHNIDALLGHESQIEITSVNYAERSQLFDPYGIEFDNAAITDNVGGDKTNEMMDSYFAQFRYNYKERYFAEINGRYDGSSKFRPGSRWGAFGSVGASWLISSEPFMKPVKRWLSTLKLRASYGTLGNQDTGSFLWTNIYRLRSLDSKPALSWYRPGNPNITWERVNGFDLGLEFTILKDRLDAEVIFYDRTTKNLIMSIPSAPSIGIGAIPTNDGILNNRGVELALKSKLVKTRDVELSLRLNLAHNKTQMVKMQSEYRWGEMRPVISPAADYDFHAIFYPQFLGVADWVDLNKDGKKTADECGISQWLAYYDLNDPTWLDGSTKYITNLYHYLHADTVGGGLIHPNARVVKDTVNDPRFAGIAYTGKKTRPDVFGGFGLDLTAHGFEFSFFFNYQIGGYMVDYVYQAMMEDQTLGSYAWHKDMLKAWNPITGNTSNLTVPRVSAGLDSRYWMANSSSTRFLTSNSALQLANVRIGYTFPSKWTKKALMNSASIYFSADNLFVVTARKGYFPFSYFEGGSDRSQYIPLSTVMVGIKLQF